MSHSQDTVWRETMFEQLRELAYQYEKTGLYQYADDYFKLSGELLEHGIKAEHLPIIRRKTDVA